MNKTTLYLPEDLHRAVKQAASREGVPEAEVIRRAIAHAVGGARVRPRGGLFAGAGPVARTADEFLTGFGER